MHRTDTRKFRESGRHEERSGHMPIEFEDHQDGVRRITLSGRIDIPGTEEISMPFAVASASAARRVLVDLRQVSLLASIGIRALVSNAKAQQMRGGRLVLFVGENTNVLKTLEITGIDAILPTYTDEREAIAAALA